MVSLGVSRYECQLSAAQTFCSYPVLDVGEILDQAGVVCAPLVHIRHLLFISLVPLLLVAESIIFTRRLEGPKQDPLNRF